MYLPDHALLDLVEKGVLGVAPFDPGNVQPASIDLRLHRRILVLDDNRCLDPARDSADCWQRIDLAPRDESFTIMPRQFILATTYERITMPAGLLGRLEGKSSIGRHGVRVHSTAGFIDPGFDGHITLELSNDTAAPVRLWPGMKIGQLSVAVLTSAAARPYGSGATGSRYQGQEWPTPSRSFDGFTCGLPDDEVPA